MCESCLGIGDEYVVSWFDGELHNYLYGSEVTDFPD